MKGFVQDIEGVNRHADWTPTGVASHRIEERRTRNSWSILDAGLQLCGRFQSESARRCTWPPRVERGPIYH
jgi:hypothetical protein